MSYRGRFAPSPTGALHFGSLIAAVGSYLEAKAAGGQWLVRIEDLDPPREVPGAAAGILRSLERLGFEWDEAVLYQSTRLDAYRQALQGLRDADLAYPCSCSRSEILESVTAAEMGEELRYPGFCRLRPRNPAGPFAYRLRAPQESVRFRDVLQGEFDTDLQATIGDFVLKRRDGLFAYQLAVVVDDHAQGITHIVRGADLLSNTPRQIALQGALGFPTPSYSHLPLVTDAAGHKLSKATDAPAIDLMPPSRTLWKALDFLRLRPPMELAEAGLPDLWAWARAHWSTRSLTGLRSAQL